MSGICAIAQARPDAGLLDALDVLSSLLAFRGPHGSGIWRDDHVGLAHRALNVDDAAPRAQQPRSIDGFTWICADARIDAQPVLRRELAREGCNVAANADDAELILHAWSAWREQCVDHLLGDFAFVIWDSRSRLLFAARDHWGVKPFFYAATSRGVIASNTLEAVLAHPAVDASLDETWIGDFLLFGASRDSSATVRSSVRRLPPAHCMTWAPDAGLHVKRYWSLPVEWGMPVDEPDPVARLKAVLIECVADRMRGRAIGVELSGGLDSSSVAAIAHGLLSRGVQPFDLQAQTLVFDHVVDSAERKYAGLVAAALGIPIHFFVGDDPALLASDAATPQRYPEPVDDEEPKIGAALAMHAAAIAPVFLTGWDGDALLDESPKPYLRWLWRSGQRAHSIAMAMHYAAWRRRFPHPFRSMPRRETPAFPEWIDADFAQRARLHERWDEAAHEHLHEHPVRPNAYRALGLLDGRLNLLEGYDAGRTGCPVEYRHPMLDLRFVRCALSLPPMPWCVKKEALRRAMAGVLPAPVLARPKEPWPAHLNQRFLDLASRPPWPPQMHSFVDERKLPADPTVEQARVLWLARWLGFVSSRAGKEPCA